MSKKIKVGIVGATGYTGVELLRLLAAHPDVEVAAVTSRSEAGTAVADYFPSLRGVYGLAFQTPDEAGLEQCDIVFFATPNGIAMKDAPRLIEQGVRVIDLSADFRIWDIPTWEHWYGMTHAAPRPRFPSRVRIERTQPRSRRTGAPRRQPRLLPDLRIPAARAAVAAMPSEARYAADCRLQIRRVRRGQERQCRFAVVRSRRQLQSLRHSWTPPPARNQADHRRASGRHRRRIRVHAAPRADDTRYARHRLPPPFRRHLPRNHPARLLPRQPVRGHPARRFDTRNPQRARRKPLPHQHPTGGAIRCVGRPFRHRQPRQRRGGSGGAKYEHHVRTEGNTRLGRNPPAPLKRKRQTAGIVPAVF